MEREWPELLKSAPVFFVEKNGYNEDTYGAPGGADRIWEVTAAGLVGRYSINRYANETTAVESFKAEFKKYAERREVDWERWEIILLAPND